MAKHVKKRIYSTKIGLIYYSNKGQARDGLYRQHYANRAGEFGRKG